MNVILHNRLEFKLLGKWGIILFLTKMKQLLNKFRSRIFLKLMVINLLVIGIVIWLAGVSVYDFACLLVNQLHMVGEEKSRFFNQTMEFYLIRASLIAVIVAGMIHYYLTRKVVSPLQSLVHSTKKLSTGHYPDLLKVKSRDEIGELTENFNQLITRLKKVEQIRRSMVTDMAHELRTPLSNINGYLEGLSHGVIKGDKALYQSIHEESLRLTRMIDQLYQLTEWEYKQLSEREMGEGMDIKPFLEKYMELFDWEFEQNGISYQISLEHAKVVADRDGLKQVINNLIQNAIQYRVGNGDISIHGRKDKEMYKITVTGKGERIPEDKKDWLFERFYRSDPSRNGNTGGSGLGLAIVKDIVERHGGEVGLLSEEQRYSFWFTIPIVQ